MPPKKNNKKLNDLNDDDSTNTLQTPIRAIVPT